MQAIWIRERLTRQVRREKVYAAKALDLLYARRGFAFLRHLISHFPFFSLLYGAMQKWPRSARKVAPFIEQYEIDMGAFEKQEYPSFNAFFTRKLKPGARPIAETPAILPADGRYRLFEEAESFVIKGKRFDLETLLARPHPGGSLVIARLAPVDYHRFHFPVDGTIVKQEPIRGPLYSVNPIAICQNMRYLIENKRVVTEIATKTLGTVFMVEIGATHVGSIVQTFHGERAIKGEEKGYFEFGGSCIALVFERGAIAFAEDLKDEYEVLGQMGQPLGVRR